MIEGTRVILPSITAFVAVILWTLVLVIIYVSQVDDVRTVNGIDKIKGVGRGDELSLVSGCKVTDK